MGSPTAAPRFLALLGLVALLPGCFTIGTILRLSTEHTLVELSVDRAWLTTDGRIEIDIDVDSGNGEERALHASIARSALETAFAAAIDAAPQHLPASAVHLGPKTGPPAAETVNAGIPVVRLAKGAPNVEGPKGEPLDFGIAAAARVPGSDTQRSARFEITLEDPAGKNSQSDLVRLLLAVGLDLLIISLISRIPFGVPMGA